MTRFIFISAILLWFASPLDAQPVFAGTWLIDHSKSDAEFRDYRITCNITQTPEAITVEQMFVMQDGQKTSMKPVTYNLGGKPLSKEEQGGTDNITASLSADKKVLTTKFVRTMNGENFVSPHA